MEMVMKPRARLWVLAVVVIGVLGGTGPGAAVEIGAPAPDFTLPSTTGRPISLGQFKTRKIVLLEFYVADFGPT